MRYTLYLVLPALLMIAGCGKSGKGRFTVEEMAEIPLPQRQGLPAPSGGFVLVVCDEAITAEQIVRPLMRDLTALAAKTDFPEFSRQAKPVINRYLIAKVSDILLYNEAKKDAGEQIDELIERAVESEVKKFVTSFNGDYAKAEEELERMVMTWQSFREYQKKMILSQSYLSSKMTEPKPITYADLLDAYEQIKRTAFVAEAALTFQLIDIQPDKLTVIDPNKTKAVLAAELAEQLSKRLSDGENFEQLAKEYSHGHRKDFGGLWQPVNPESLAEPYDILAAKAEALLPGQISTPIKTDAHIFIMKLIAKQSASVVPFEKAQKEVEARLIIQRRNQSAYEIRKKLFEQATIARTEQFTDYCLKKIYTTANN